MAKKRRVEKVGEEKAHAKFGASGSERWLSCPGSIELSEDAPEQEDSAAAEEGTRGHGCLEFILKNNSNMSAAVKLAAKTYPPEMVEHATDAASWILERLEESSNAVLLCETRVDSSPFTCEGQFGTVDAAIVEEFGKLTVIDYKYGFFVVEPSGDDGLGNSQLIYYALGLSHQYDHNFSEVELVVIQPRAWHESGNTVRTFSMTMDELLSWEDVFKNGVKAAQESFAPLHTGKWCKFCPAVTYCPEFEAASFGKASITYSDKRGVESMPEPRFIKTPNLGVMLDACDHLENWISQVRSHAHHVLKRGHSIDGWKLVQKNSPRRWIDKEDASRSAKRTFGDFAFELPSLLSPAQLEEQAKKGKPELVKEVASFLEHHVTRESSGHTLVKDTDKRPAVNPLEKVFGEVVELKKSEVKVTTRKKK